METDFQFLLRYVLEQAVMEAPARRAQLYRGLAHACADEHEQQKLLAMSDAVLNADKLCREFEFNFVQLSKAGNGDPVGGGQ